MWVDIGKVSMGCLGHHGGPRWACVGVVKVVVKVVVVVVGMYAHLYVRV